MPLWRHILAGIIILLAALLFAPSDLRAEDGYEEAVKEIQREIEELREENKQRQKRLEALEKRLEDLQADSLRGGGTPGAESASERIPVAEDSAQIVEEKSTETPAGQLPESQQRKPEEGTETILVERGGVLLPQGTLQIEPEFNYTHFSRNVINLSGFTLFEAILIGRVEVEQIKRDILTGAMTFRYGILDPLQFEFKVPYLYRQDRLVRPADAVTVAGVDDVRVIRDHGLGDIEGGFDFYAFKSRSWLPDLILNVRGKSRTGKDPYELETEEVGGEVLTTELPTGTGHYGFSGGFTLVKTIDPVVFFGGADYFWNFERDVGGDFGEIDPGNSIEYDIGMATALSERISLTLSFQNIFTQSTLQNDDKLPESQTNAASVFIGASCNVSDRTSLFGSVGIGLTEDSPDFQFQLNVPFTFPLF